MKNRIFKGLSYLLLGTGVLVVTFPFLWAILLSLKSNAEIMQIPPAFFPKEIFLKGYELVFTESPIGYWFLNSLIVSLVSVAGTCFLSALGGYIFAKFQFFGKNILFMLVMMTMMIPFQVTMIPVYLICSRLKLINTLLALIFPGLASGFGIFLCKQMCEEVPEELIEAGRLEGASEFHIFLKLVLPNLKSTLSALAIFTFVAKWNDYQWPLIAINEERRMTLPLALKFFQTSNIMNMNATMSASVIIIVPIILMFLIFQRQFIEGMTISGMK